MAAREQSAVAFKITYRDGTTQNVIAGLGDMTRMEMKYGGGWRDNAEDHLLEYSSYLAWLAARHDDTRPPVDFDTFLDQYESLEQSEVPVVPFDAAPPNASPSSYRLPPPVDAPTRVDGWTPTPVTP